MAESDTSSSGWLPPIQTFPPPTRGRRQSVAVNADGTPRLPPLSRYNNAGRNIDTSNGEYETGTTKLEDQFTNDKLRKLQAIFQEADEDGGGGLDMEEFRVAMRSTLGDSSLTDSELDMLFMKVRLLYRYTCSRNIECGHCFSIMGNLSIFGD